MGLAATPRELVYNDFIHVVDGLRFLAKLAPNETPEKIHVNTYMQDGLLANVHIQFKHLNTFVEGSMNRISGISEEQLDVFVTDEKFVIKSLVRGEHYKLGNSTQLGFNDWQSHLYTRGFEDMLQDWLVDLKKGVANSNRLENILATHFMCENIIEKIDKDFK